MDEKVVQNPLRYRVHVESIIPTSEDMMDKMEKRTLVTTLTSDTFKEQTKVCIQDIPHSIPSTPQRIRKNPNPIKSPSHGDMDMDAAIFTLPVTNPRRISISSVLANIQESSYATPPRSASSLKTSFEIQDEEFNHSPHLSPRGQTQIVTHWTPPNSPTSINLNETHRKLTNDIFLHYPVLLKDVWEKKKNNQNQNQTMDWRNRENIDISSRPWMKRKRANSLVSSVSVISDACSSISISSLSSDDGRADNDQDEPKKVTKRAPNFLGSPISSSSVSVSDCFKQKCIKSHTIKKRKTKPKPKPSTSKTIITSKREIDEIISPIISRPRTRHDFNSLGLKVSDDEGVKAIFQSKEYEKVGVNSTSTQVTPGDIERAIAKLQAVTSTTGSNRTKSDTVSTTDNINGKKCGVIQTSLLSVCNNRGRKMCDSCKRTETPCWRPGWNSGIILCNSCGLRYKKSPIVCSQCKYIPDKAEYREIQQQKVKRCTQCSSPFQ